MIDRLQDEQKQQTENHKCVLARIDHEKASYFNTSVTRNRSITQFLQLCIFPRCCFTITDALYCAQFALFLHQQRTPHFSTLLFYDRVFSDISYTVTCCTENETRRYGRFLQSVLVSISRWHESKSVYDVSIISRDLLYIAVYSRDVVKLSWKVNAIPGNCM